MRRYSLLAVALTFAVSLVVATSSAQAIVVDMNAPPGSPNVAFNPFNQSGYYGVALVPTATTRTTLTSAGIATVTSSAPCVDPALTSDFFLPDNGLCSHGGSVIHQNETFALVWDPNPYSDYAAPYVEQFMRDVADGSGTLTSPYADTAQYTDSSGRAANTSLYSGGYGFGSAYPANGCPVSGTYPYANIGPAFATANNQICLTDAQIQGELQSMVTQERLLGRVQPGYTPLLVLLLPPEVEVCLDTAGHICSANADPTHVPGTGIVPARFCSYHSQVNVAGTVISYVVQPWTPQTECDEPDAPTIPDPVDVSQLAIDEGARIVSPLSLGEMAATTDPGMNGWFAIDGSEINDNDGCVPLPNHLDQVTVGSDTYFLQREFNNAGVIVDDPFALPCTPVVNLTPSFVVPSPINYGDVVEFDGSRSPTTLLIPKANFHWTFGDGTTAVGPSAVHSYAKAGTYTATLTVTDRGGDVDTVSQSVVVIGPNIQPVGPQPSQGLTARIQLMPQSLSSTLRFGVSIRVSANEPADGIVTVTIPRSDARRAGIPGRGSAVVIGRGTLSGVKDGTVSLHLKLSRLMALKLGRIRHVTLTVRIALVGAGRDHVTIDAAGRY